MTGSLLHINQNKVTVDNLDIEWHSPNGLHFFQVNQQINIPTLLIKSITKWCLLTRTSPKPCSVTSEIISWYYRFLVLNVPVHSELFHLFLIFSFTYTYGPFSWCVLHSYVCLILYPRMYPLCFGWISILWIFYVFWL